MSFIQVGNNINRKLSIELIDTILKPKTLEFSGNILTLRDFGINVHLHGQAESHLL